MAEDTGASFASIPSSLVSISESPGDSLSTSFSSDFPSVVSMSESPSESLYPSFPVSIYPSFGDKTRSHDDSIPPKLVHISSLYPSFPGDSIPPSLVPISESPGDSDACVDSPFNSSIGDGTLGCDFVASNPQYCASGADSHCPVTCGTCDIHQCEDSEIEFTFNGEIHYCPYLNSASQQIKDQACANDDVVKTCRLTCGYCDE